MNKGPGRPAEYPTGGPHNFPPTMLLQVNKAHMQTKHLNEELGRPRGRAPNRHNHSSVAAHLLSRTQVNQTDMSANHGHQGSVWRSSGHPGSVLCGRPVPLSDTCYPIFVVPCTLFHGKNTLRSSEHPGSVPRGRPVPLSDTCYRMHVIPCALFHGRKYIAVLRAPRQCASCSPCLFTSVGREGTMSAIRQCVESRNCYAAPPSHFARKPATPNP
eukprot:1150399-Pelagomonas_calceolata.AAC.8